MESEWPIHELSEFIKIKHGFAFKGEYFKDVRTPDVLITPGNFSIGGGFKADKLKYYDGPVPADYILHEGDLVVTMTDLSKQADTLGFSALIPSLDGHRILHNQRVGLVELINDELDPTFLYYLLQSREYRHHVVSGATGTTVKHTSPTKIASFSFRKPPKNIQILIGKYLMSIEAREKINTGLNQTLEQIAQALFKSWFVDFDPVIDNALAAGNDIPEALQHKAEQRRQAQQLPDFKPLPDDIRALFPSEFEQTDDPSIGIAGWIPKGWKVDSFETIASLNTKSVMPNKEPMKVWEHYSIPSFDSKKFPKSDKGEEIKSNKYLVQPTAILVSKLNPDTKRVWWLNIKDVEAAICSTEFMQFIPKKVDNRAFVMGVIDSYPFQKGICERVTGSTGSRQRAQPKEVAKLSIVLPSDSLINKFSSLASNYYEKAAKNIEQSIQLTGLRDLLLPQLISGKITINKDVT